MDDEAAETARGGLAEAKKCTTRVECHRVLGIVATRRGDQAAAEEAFKAGAEDARGCGLYLLELLCARDLVQFVYEGQGRAAEGAAMIEAAAGRMGKEARGRLRGGAGEAEEVVTWVYCTRTCMYMSIMS